MIRPVVPEATGAVAADPTRPARLEDVIRMERLATEAAEALAGAPAEDVVRWATDTFGDRICITSSMTDAVIIHLVSRVRPGIDVIFLDTGYHFAETIGTRDAVSAVYPVNVLNVTPAQTVAEQDEQMGPRLYSRNPDLCCYLRKVVPLEQALEPYDAWITGVRKEETDARSDTRAVQWDARREMVKVNPIVDWTQDQVDAYIAENGSAGQPAGLRRLPVDRLRDLHRPGRGRRRRPQRPLGGHRQDRMRYPQLSPAPGEDHAWPPPLVVAAHGSTDPRAAATVTDLARLVRARAGRAGLPGLTVRAAYLGHALPSVPDALEALHGEGRSRAVVLPLLLTEAYHSDTDLPAVLRAARRRLPGLRLAYGRPLGPHPLLLRALERRLAEAGAPAAADTAVVLAAAGSSRPAANAAVARVARPGVARAGAAWSPRTLRPPRRRRPRRSACCGKTARRASSSRPTCWRPACSPTRSASSLLAAGADAVSAALGAAPEVADIVIERYVQAAAQRGRSAPGGARSRLRPMMVKWDQGGMPMTQPAPHVTHEVLNQVPPLAGYDVADDPALIQALRREAGAGRGPGERAGRGGTGTGAPRTRRARRIRRDPRAGPAGQRVPAGAAYARCPRPPDRRGRIPPGLARADGHRREPRAARRAVAR